MIFHPRPTMLLGPMLAAAYYIPTSLRGRNYLGYPTGSIENFRLPTDAVGTCDVTIVNAVVGSRYRIEISATGAPVAEGDVVTSDFAVSVPYYAIGNTNNVLRIKIRKGTVTPFYKPFETQAVVNANGVSAYVLQQLDE